MSAGTGASGVSGVSGDGKVGLPAPGHDVAWGS